MWVTVVIDPNQHKRRQVADAYGRTVTVQEYTNTHNPAACSGAAGSPYATTTNTYDVLGNLTTVTDALGNQTTMTYDTLSRKTAMHDPDMGNWSYVYDAAGNLTQQSDAKNQNLYFRYDALNRRKQKDYGTQKADGAGDVVYTYDGATADNLVGRLALVTDSTGTITFKYDVLGQLSTSTRTLFTTPYTFSYTRDTMSRLSTVTYPDNSVITYTYNGPFADQVKEGSTVYAQYNNYNALGQPVSIAYSNGVTTYFTNPAPTFRLQSLQTTKTGGSVYQNLEYAYDDVGNVSSITDYLTAANSQTFTYDDLNRLLTGSAGAYGTITYSYNQIGNMTSNSQVGSYTYPASGSSSVRPHAVTTAGSNSYTYDANGNMLTGAGRTFDTYDVENRPTSITSGGQTTTFTYDGDGGRVKKTTGASVVWYISKLYECDTTSCQKYIWSGDRRIAVKQVSNGQLHFYHGDHLGSTNVVTDGTGVEVQRVNYTPFGEVLGSPIPTIAYKYTGKERDSATGLYWYEWRSYDPLLARFTTPDTLVPNPRDPQDLNRYSYVGNNPLRYTDPTGHFKLKINKFFKRAFGDIGTTVVGAAFGMVTGCYVCGAAIMTQSESGRNALSAAIVAVTVTAAVVCTAGSGGGCAPFVGAAIGAVTGGTLGGYSASKNGGDLSSGILFGASVGAATGAAGGYIQGLDATPFSALIWNSPEGLAHGLNWLGIKAQAGIISNFGSGLTSAYQGGKGQLGNMLIEAAKNGATGAITTPLAAASFDLLGNLFSLPGDAKPYYVLDESGNSVLAPSTEGLKKIGEALNTTPAQILFGSFGDTASEIYGEKLVQDGRKIRFP